MNATKQLAKEAVAHLRKLGQEPTYQVILAETWEFKPAGMAWIVWHVHVNMVWKKVR